ncbi:MAG: InlB B-repeat-containing protein [Rhodoluna sp.]|nr:InlB B-repeat-containing protein [Rhodoluna sp.]
MSKFRLFSSVAVAAIIGLTLTTSPSLAAENEGLNVAVYTYEGGGSPDRTATYTLCPNAWTHADNIDSDFDQLGSVAGCQPDSVIVHYTGFVTFPDSGSYSFLALADDGFWMSLDGNGVITGDWYDKGRYGDPYQNIAIVGGQEYAIDAWFYENGGGANATLQYMLEGRDSDWITVPTAFFKTTSVPQFIDVAFDTEGGEAISTVTYQNGDDGLVLPTPAKDGFVFSGWAKDSLDGLIIDTETYIPDAAVTLHAIWTKILDDDVKRTLADTGFSPWPLVFFGLAFVAGGLVVIRKTKRS